MRSEQAEPAAHALESATAGRARHSSRRLAGPDYTSSRPHNRSRLARPGGEKRESFSARETRATSDEPSRVAVCTAQLDSASDLNLACCHDHAERPLACPPPARLSRVHLPRRRPRDLLPTAPRPPRCRRPPIASACDNGPVRRAALFSTATGASAVRATSRPFRVGSSRGRPAPCLSRPLRREAALQRPSGLAEPLHSHVDALDGHGDAPAATAVLLPPPDLPAQHLQWPHRQRLCSHSQRHVQRLRSRHLELRRPPHRDGPRQTAAPAPAHRHGPAPRHGRRRGCPGRAPPPQSRLGRLLQERHPQGSHRHRRRRRRRARAPGTATPARPHAHRDQRLSPPHGQEAQDHGVDGIRPRLQPPADVVLDHPDALLRLAQPLHLHRPDYLGPQHNRRHLAGLTDQQWPANLPSRQQCRWPEAETHACRRTGRGETGQETRARPRRQPVQSVSTTTEPSDQGKGCLRAGSRRCKTTTPTIPVMPLTHCRNLLQRTKR